MRSLCFNNEQLNRFIEIECAAGEFFDDEIEFRNTLVDWRAWETEIVFLATTLSQVLERKIKLGQDAHSLLDNVSALLNSACLSIEGFDENFVTFMFHHRRRDEMTMEEELIRIRNLIGDHAYERGGNA